MDEAEFLKRFDYYLARFEAHLEDGKGKDIRAQTAAILNVLDRLDGTS